MFVRNLTIIVVYIDGLEHKKSTLIYSALKIKTKSIISKLKSLSNGKNNCKTKDGDHLRETVFDFHRSIIGKNRRIIFVPSLIKSALNTKKKVIRNEEMFTGNKS